MGFMTQLEMLEKKIDPKQLDELIQWALRNRKNLKKWSVDELAFVVTLCLPDIPKPIVGLLAPDLFLYIQSGNTFQERYEFRVSARGIHEDWRSSDKDHRDTQMRRKFLIPLWEKMCRETPDSY